jgi:hypothetical protein
MIVIADGALSTDEAVLKLDDYPLKTLCRYDLPGPGDPYLLTREELIRTRALRSRIRNAELDWFLDRASSAPWPPPEADLRQADPGVAGGLYDQLAALYEHFRNAAPPGIAMAKISKVLHLKRPTAYPILDRKITSTYRHAAGQAALLYPGRGYKRMFWAAIRLDLITNTESGALAALRRSLGGAARFQANSRVTDLRLLDMLTWR